MVLDPISALGLAGNIVQFVDYTSGVISKSVEQYRSAVGCSRELIDTELVAQHLRKLAISLEGDPGLNGNGLGVQGRPQLDQTSKELLEASDRRAEVQGRCSLEQISTAVQESAPNGAEMQRRPEFSRTWEGTQKMSGSEAELQQLARSCHKIAAELIDMVNDLKLDPGLRGGKRRIQSLRQALRGAGKEGNIRALERSLATHRSELTLQMAMLTRDTGSSLQRDLRNLQKSIEDMQINRHQSLDGVMQSLKSIERNTDKALGSQELSTLHTCLATTVTTAATVAQLSQEQLVLSSLNFESLPVRQSNIREAHAATFEWIFRAITEPLNKSATDTIEPSKRDMTLREWLETPHDGNGIYWITGKAGSGKSTLVKFLNHHPQTEILLRKWAGSNKRLIIASHYFWHAGTQLQKSQEGLLRSLLYEILRECPELIPVICPERWKSTTELKIWSRAELFETLKRLGTQATVSAKFCFLVDGLDEYEGDHSELLELLAHAAAIPNVKLCVSCRPWVVFRAAYDTSNCRLCLQDLTRKDIEIYVRDHLEANEDFLLAKSGDSRYGQFISKVLGKAQGVFLWVFLAVRSLLQGLRSDDTIPTLESRLDELPDELESLFQRMLDGIEKFYKQKSERTFKMALVAPSPFSLMAYSMLDEEDSEDIYRWGLQPLTSRNISKRQKRTRKQINAVTQGLLEVVMNPLPSTVYFAHDVDFLHGTVRDFLLENQRLYCSGTDHGFEVYSFLCLALLGEYKGFPSEACTSSEEHSLLDKVKRICIVAREAEITTKQAQSAVLDELEQSMIKRNHIRLIQPRLPDTDAVRMDGQVLFLCYCVSVGLIEYIKLRICRDPSVLETGNLLGFALEACVLGDFQRGSVEMVQLLLDKGADSNMTFSDSTAFGKFLSNCWKYKYGDERRSQTESFSRHFCRVLDLLLQYGADPNISRKGNTLWGLFLMPSRLLSPTDRDNLFHVIQSFIDHKANPNLPLRGFTIWGCFLNHLAFELPPDEPDEDWAFHCKVFETLLVAGAGWGSLSEIGKIHSDFGKQKAEQLEEIMERVRSKCGKDRKKLGARSNALKKLRARWSRERPHN
ncbi:MAG: hypothetical protein Q9157_003642 [Trypethelium eluteriae]